MKYIVEIDAKGTKFWYNEKGQYHREDGPAIEYPDGTKFWFMYDEMHRDSGPAVEYSNGIKCWYRRGKLHREDGPAIEKTNGYKEWWLNGKQYTEQEYNKIKNPPIVQMTMEEFVKKHGYIIRIVQG